jgi:hypothetical protein
MKNLLMLCAILTSLSAKSQTWDEWFRQKKTKLKYIAQQIAAFQVYAGYLKQGYKIVDDGWNMVNDIKHGDFDIHNNYFNSLTEVSTSIKDYDKIENITALQHQIIETSDNIKSFINANSYIQNEEKDYINKVMSNLLSECADDLGELQMLTQSGNVSMKDDERLQRIDNLYADMQDKYSFAKNFESSVRVLALSRTKNSNDVNTSKLLYGIK